MKTLDFSSLMHSTKTTFLFVSVRLLFWSCLKSDRLPGKPFCFSLELITWMKAVKLAYSFLVWLNHCTVKEQESFAASEWPRPFKFLIGKPKPLGVGCDICLRGYKPLKLNFCQNVTQRENSRFRKNVGNKAFSLDSKLKKNIARKKSILGHSHFNQNAENKSATNIVSGFAPLINCKITQIRLRAWVKGVVQRTQSKLLNLAW